MASVYRFLLKKFKTPRPLTVVSISEDTPEDFTEEIFITTTKDLNKSAKNEVTRIRDIAEKNLPIKLWCRVHNGGQGYITTQQHPFGVQLISSASTDTAAELKLELLDKESLYNYYYLRLDNELNDYLFCKDSRVIASKDPELKTKFQIVKNRPGSRFYQFQYASGNETRMLKIGNDGELATTVKKEDGIAGEFADPSSLFSVVV